MYLSDTIFHLKNLNQSRQVIPQLETLAIGYPLPFLFYRIISRTFKSASTAHQFSSNLMKMLTVNKAKPWKLNVFFLRIEMKSKHPSLSVSQLVDSLSYCSLSSPHYH